MADYAYIGTMELVYPAYLATYSNGDTYTLVGTPGMDPVTLTEAPGDGFWVPVDTKSPPASDTVTETAPEAPDASPVPTPTRTTATRSTTKSRKGAA